MPKSKHEEELARQLTLASATAGMVREHHPYWCCEHKKALHHSRHPAPPPQHVPSALGRTFTMAYCETCMLAGLWSHEYRRERNWRIDFAWPIRKLAVEVEGGIWKQGRHTRGSGFKADTGKYNRLESDGWTVLRFEDSAINSGEALNVIMRQLGEDDGTRERVSEDIYGQASLQPTQSAGGRRPVSLPLRKGRRSR